MCLKLLDAGTPRKKKTKDSSTTLTISSAYMWEVLERLKHSQTRKSTRNNYHKIWNQFNCFMMRLDRKPDNWENRVALFCTFLIEKGTQSSTVKSYISAIKHILKADGYPWNENAVILNSLTKACRVINDKVYHRQPISKSLLEIMLFEIEHMFPKQWYLEILYKTIFCIGYYGLFRIGELAAENDEACEQNNHAIKACNVHIGKNKNKILFVLYSSKTHSKESLPQKVKIKANDKPFKQTNEHFCPFRLFTNFMSLRGNYASKNEQLFVFRDRKPVCPYNIRSTLDKCLCRLGIDHSMYSVHSLRVGRTSDLVKLGYSIEEVKRMGRWKSNAVYRYIKLW